MKITGTIEISGCNRVVFYKKNLFERVETMSGSSYWWDARRNRRLSSEVMADIVRTMAIHPARRVWTEGGTINIDRKKIKKQMVQIPVRLANSFNRNSIYSLSPLITAGRHG